MTHRIRMARKRLMVARERAANKWDVLMMRGDPFWPDCPYNMRSNEANKTLRAIERRTEPIA
jgi:hypothetical protein